MALAVLLGAAVAGCGDDGDGDEGAPPAVEERVLALLRSDPSLVGSRAGELGDALVTCPAIDDLVAGDRATCTLRFGDGSHVEVDLELQPDGSLVVVAVLEP